MTAWSWPWKKRPSIWKWDDEHTLRVFSQTLDPTPATFTFTLPDAIYGRITSIELNASTDAIAGTRYVFLELRRSGITIARGATVSATTSLRQWIFHWTDIAQLNITTSTTTNVIIAPLRPALKFMPLDQIVLTPLTWLAGDFWSQFILTIEPYDMY